MIDDVFRWLDTQSEWIQRAAYVVLSSTSISEESIAELVELLKNEDKEALNSISYPKSNPVVPVTLRIESIGPVVGIDAMNSRKPLCFGNGSLALIFGANGSGKSGYTRIISRACGKRSSVDLRSNVYKTLPTKQGCAFSYTFNGLKESVVWEAQSGPLAQLASVDVFDSQTGRLYLEKDTGISYELPELKVFSDLVHICGKVQEKLQIAKMSLASKLPILPDQYRETESGRGYSSLASGIAVDRLEFAVVWTSDDELELKSTENTLTVTDPADALQSARDREKQIDRLLGDLQNAIRAIDSKSINEIRDLQAESARLRGVARQGAGALMDSSAFATIGTATWLALWEAARKYSAADAYVGAKFPHTDQDARCILCHQILDDAAKTRLTRFEHFVKGELESSAAAAEKKLADRLKELPTPPDPSLIEASCQAAGLGVTIQSALASWWKQLEDSLRAVRLGEAPTATSEGDNEIAELLRQLTSRLNSLRNQIAEITASDAGDTTLLLRQKYLELHAKKWVSQQAEAITSEIARLKETESYDRWMLKTRTTGISRKAGELSEKLVTEAYVGRFNTELAKLGASRVQVVLVKTGTKQGEVRHSIQLKDTSVKGAKVLDILSEGESRIVSLAAFLADVTGRRSTSPFIFDDPISSLDQVFEERVIARLIELSIERQVVVFTHRLSFLGIMSDIAGANLHEVQIRREPWGTGEPSEVSFSCKNPEKALKNIQNEKLAKARRVYESEGSHSYYVHAKAICSDLRILVERIVETILLADVVKRHRRAVNTQGKVSELAKITQADSALVDKMMTKYSCFEHSQSSESPVEVPDPAELDRDIVEILDWIKEFKSR